MPRRVPSIHRVTGQGPVSVNVTFGATTHRRAAVESRKSAIGTLDAPRSRAFGTRLAAIG